MIFSFLLRCKYQIELQSELDIDKSFQQTFLTWVQTFPFTIQIFNPGIEPVTRSKV